MPAPSMRPSNPLTTVRTTERSRSSPTTETNWSRPTDDPANTFAIESRLVATIDHPVAPRTAPVTPATRPVIAATRQRAAAARSRHASLRQASGGHA